MKKVIVGEPRSVFKANVLCPDCGVAFIGVATELEGAKLWLYTHRTTPGRCAWSLWHPRKVRSLGVERRRLARRRNRAAARSVGQKPHCRWGTRYEHAFGAWREEAPGPVGWACTVAGTPGTWARVKELDQFFCLAFDNGASILGMMPPVSEMMRGLEGKKRG